MAQWFEITLQADTIDPESIEDALVEIGALAVTLTDAEDNPVLEPLPGETPLWPNTLITGLFALPCDIDQIKADLLLYFDNAYFDNPEHTEKSQLLTSPLKFIKSHQLEDCDWVRAWMDHYKPMAFGEHLWICPTHMSPPDPTATTVMLDPGLAFGTGTHPTTALCLKWLSDNKAEIFEQNVIDYGCGSGVLAIAAKMLGAKACFGTDIDPQAITATLTNSQRNQVEISASLPDKFIAPRAHIVLANILAGPLIALAPVLANLTQANGHIVLAGLLERDAQLVKDAYNAWFKFMPDASLDGWTRLHGIKQ